MTDAERLALIDRAYTSLLNYRNPVSRYIRKNISVSYLRAKKKNDTDWVMALYEKNSGWHQVIRVENTDIVNAEVINELKIK